MNMKKEKMARCTICNNFYPYSKNQFSCDECIKKAVLEIANIIHYDKTKGNNIIEKAMNDLVDTFAKIREKK